MMKKFIKRLIKNATFHFGKKHDFRGNLKDLKDARKKTKNVKLFPHDLDDHEL